MTTAPGKENVQRLHQEAFAGDNQDAVDELVAANFVLHSPDGGQGRKEHFTQELPTFRAARTPAAAYPPLLSSDTSCTSCATKAASLAHRIV